jgi:hypothetical protein
MSSIELHVGHPGTSAEPALDEPWDELRICRETVAADMIAGDLADVPLLTPAELDFARRFADRRFADKLPPGAWARGLVLTYLLAASRQEARNAIVRENAARALSEITTAALRVEGAVQDRLWCLGGPGSVIEHKRYALGLWGAQWQAHRAVFAKTGSRMLAKDLQRKAARGRPPLTVCVGRKLRRLPESELRRHAPDLLEHRGDNVVWIGGDGCGTIILDSSEPRPPKKYCDGCAKKAGNTMNAGLAKNALARLKAARKPR